MILVAGGTGRLGSLVVSQLRSRGLPVRVLSHDPAHAARLRRLDVEVVRGDIRNPEELPAAVSNVQTVVSAVQGFSGTGRVSPDTVDRDGNRNLIDAASRAGASFVMMSIVGAAPDSPLELLRMKYAAEQHLKSTAMPWTIVRSAAFAELWIDLLEQTAARGGKPLVFGRGQQPIEFVSVRDVAQAVEIAVLDESLRDRTIELGGPELWTFNRLAEAVQQASGRSAVPRHLPRAMLRIMGVLAGPVKPELARQARAALVMDTVPLPVANREFRSEHPEIPVTSIPEVLAASTTAHRAGAS